MDPNTILIIGVALVMSLGMLLTAVFLPGNLLIWIAALAYGAINGMSTLGWIVSIILTIVMIVSFGLSLWLQQTGARRTGASWKGIGAGCLLGVIGGIVIPIIGAPIGIVLGVYLYELNKRRDSKEAWFVTKGALVGLGAGYIQELLVGILMIATWAIWVYFG